MGDGPYFAHGGSGIVLSNGALKQIYHGIPTCTVDYTDCWAGDVRIALCLRDNGILIHEDSFKLPGFHNTAPIMVSLEKGGGWWPDPCLTPMTFHHLRPWQAQVLYDVEKDNRRIDPGETQRQRTPTTFANILQGFRDVTKKLDDLARLERKHDKDINGNDDNSHSEPLYQRDTNRKGSDYRKIFFRKDKANVSEQVYFKRCREACIREKKCSSWTFDASYCWLKNGIPELTTQKGVVSGVVMENYVCPKG